MEGVEIVDFGIRSYELAYALADDYDAVILIHASSRYRTHGTLCLIEPDLEHLEDLEPESVNPSGMDPVAAFRLARSLGGNTDRLYLVACEPEDLSVTEGEDKPTKCPHMFRASGAMILNKIDLLPFLSFAVDRCVGYAREVNPEIEAFPLSATTGNGVDEWFRWLKSRIHTPRAA